MLVRQPDLLLLDEPTNHLDLAAIERLESFLPSTRARSCWSRTTARSSAPCAARSSSSRTASSSATRSATTSTSSSATRAWSARAPSTSGRRSTSTRPRTSSAATWRARRPSRRRAGARCWRSWSAWSGPRTSWEYAGKIGLSFSTGDDLGEQGDDPRAAASRSATPGDAVILRDVTANIYRGDKVGIVGPNGAGKSTLLKTLIGELPPLEGKVETGTGVRIGYFDQKLGTLERGAVADRRDPHRARRPLARGGAQLPGASSASSATTRSAPCAGCRAASAAAWPWRRSCCSRATCWCSTSRPTTSTSPRARRWRRRSATYEGTLLVVSHDRYFLDRICTRLLVIEGERRRGAPRQLQRLAPARARGGRARRRRRRRRRPPAETAPQSQGSGAPAASPAPTRKDRAPPARRRERELRRLERRVETLEADVGKLEAELAAVRAELAGDHAGDWQKLHTLADRERELDALLARRMAEWEAASTALAERRARSDAHAPRHVLTTRRSCMARAASLKTGAAPTDLILISTSILPIASVECDTGHDWCRRASFWPEVPGCVSLVSHFRALRSRPASCAGRRPGGSAAPSAPRRGRRHLGRRQSAPPSARGWAPATRASRSRSGT